MDIPTKYSPKEVEPKILKKWLESNCFHTEADAKYPDKHYCIVIPPPNVTGILHMGHGLNNTIQDVLIRYRRMQGYQSLWMPGTDHAGIATQNVVEKALAQENLRKEDIGREKFIERLWSWKDQYGSTIIEQLKKLGSSCDWQRTRFTMDEGYSQAVKEVFIKLYKKGLIYRGNRIINWCPRCKTALSDEESARKEIDGWLYYIKYPIQGKNLPKNKQYIVVATTRPETMLGDTAVAINPSDRRYSWLKENKVILPIVERKLKIIEDEAIDPEFGTGIVKVTPAHDPTDSMLGKKHNLEFVNIMAEDATLNSNAPEDFIGMDRFEAREALLAVLAEKKLIEKKEPYKISAGHCYRCHTIIEPRISLQWFVKMQPLAKEAIKVVEQDKIKFCPQRWKKVYLNWMYNIQDWCISRQIWWGHRIPVWYCTDCQKKGPEAETKKGVIVSKEMPEKCPDCGGKNLVQDEDVLDTWFSSWLWPFATFGWPKESKDLKYFYPTNCLVTASEILFFWVARMIMSGLEFMGQIPFKDVLIHGTVRDEKGIKMSKSLGNIIDPLEIIERFGADALRFSLMLLAASGSDVYLSDEKFLVGRNFSNKIWNATRFLLLKVNENNLRIDNLDFKDIDSIDKWVLSRLNKTIEKVGQCLDEYSLNEATKEIYDFFWHVFCDWYIEIAKDNFTVDKAKVLIYVLINTMKLLHPIMPYITEEIFNLIKDTTELKLDDTIVNSSWPSKYTLDAKPGRLNEVDSLLNTISDLRNIKVDLGLGQKKAKLEVAFKKPLGDLWKNNIAWICRLSNSIDVEFKSSLERILYANSLWSVNIGIDTLELDAFLASVEKKILNLEGVLKKADKKLKNEKFLQKASAVIIEKEKNKFTNVTEEIKRLKKIKDVFK